MQKGKDSFYCRYVKRGLDFLLSFFALIVLSPIMLMLTIMGAIIMKGNPFFIQPRPGKNEKIFNLIKFRTMTCEKDEFGKLLPDDKRLVPYGRFLRSTSLDELPELVNILKGEMAIVGPRPQLVRDMVFMTDEQRKRHRVCPGLSGLAQIRGRNAISWEYKLNSDLEYIEAISFLGDLKIILQTVTKVIKREEISADGMETAEDFGDYLLRIEQISRDEYDKKQIKAIALFDCQVVKIRR